jgi:putative FmdB family regulatory protein
MYDYRCNSCGYKFDKLVSFSASEKSIECPKCKKHDSKKLLCAPNISNGENSGQIQSGCNAPSGFS